ncbi:MAG: hypothetical protein GY906_23810 [bacterium]|nr:hypothetical protein [bacterium]
MNVLTRNELALIAKVELANNGGFTLDLDGSKAVGSLWAVSVQGKEQVYPGRPSLHEVRAYLDRFPYFGGAYFGGWYDKAKNVTYLDHTLLFSQKHTAMMVARENKQKAIYNLETGETVDFSIGDLPLVFDKDGALVEPADDSKTIIVNLGDYSATGVENIPEGYVVEMRDYDCLGDWEKKGVDRQGNTYEYIVFTPQEGAGNPLLLAAEQAFSLLCSEDNPRYQDCIDTLDVAIQTERENR